ncbi:O-antigen ligase [Rosenbergiella nectarea]|uniref:O-antigen ligase n=1 Tax=Rosenbergiella nectarea TaxID=988801 RepID=A0A1H9HYF3_9GAMM|nr:O-antigen ligase family protein [Rosenbergiella nectarea]SEQ67297.1 O-antigen ligase [Rosenbergiella nectarea]
MSKREFFYGISMLLLPIIAFLAPTEWIMGRNAMFLALFILTIQFVVCRESGYPLNKTWVLIAATVGCISLCQLGWVVHFGDKSVTGLLANTQYAKTYKFLMPFSLLVFLTSAIPNKVIYRFRFALLGMICLAFGVGAGEGIYTYFSESSARANIGGISTTAAYLATIQGLLCIYAINTIAVRYKRCLMALVSIVTFTIIVMTGTRSATLLFPIILLFMILKSMALKDVIKIVPAFIALLTVPVIASHQIRDRFVEAYHEISHESTNNSTSIGSRFSMWNSGLSTSSKHLLGQSAESRFNDITQYINANEKGNAEALRNIPYHLHNELIDIASLQGIIPAAFMLTFYALTIMAFRKQGRTDLAAFTFTLPIVVFGIGDVLMIYPKAIFCVFAALCLYSLLIRIDSEVSTQAENSSKAVTPEVY